MYLAHRICNSIFYYLIVYLKKNHLFILNYEQWDTHINSYVYPIVHYYTQVFKLKVYFQEGLGNIK